MFRICRFLDGCLAAAVLGASLAAGAAETTAPAKQDRVSTGVQAISQNPANRLAPVPVGNETFTSFTLEPGVRVTVQRPIEKLVKRPHVVLYLLPNGNTTEQGLGRAAEPGLDWHYGIQHIAAQTRRVRELWTSRSVITAVVEADTLSWPAWRKAVDGADTWIRELTEDIRKRAGGPEATIDLIAHSGGGSYIWGVLNAHDSIPDHVQHIVLIDANYSYSDEDGHGEKLVAWLQKSPEHRLIVLAYDDRRVTINGKPIVSETGGTWRATDRMARRLEQDLEFAGGTSDGLQTSVSLNGQVFIGRHPNPENKILHTVLVEKNGFVSGVLWGRLELAALDRPFANNPVYMANLNP